MFMDLKRSDDYFPIQSVLLRGTTWSLNIAQVNFRLQTVNRNINVVLSYQTHILTLASFTAMAQAKNKQYLSTYITLNMSRLMKTSFRCEAAVSSAANE